MICRSRIGVSPVRTVTRIEGISSPALNAACEISASGCCRFFWMSLLSAFSGETYKTRVRSSRVPVSASLNKVSMQLRKAARVLPEPVGAAIRASVPEEIVGQLRSWTSVGEPKRAVNHD
jgi:hypothetical protein